MKTQRTIQCLTCVALLLAALCGTVQAGPSFFEDFSDGVATDGTPVNWLPGSGAYLDPGFGYVLTPEGLELVGATAADAAGTPHTYRDLSARAQIKIISNHTQGCVAGLGLRYRTPTNGYWIDVESPNRFSLGHASGVYLRTVTLPFNVEETELIIRVDIVGDQIKCWCWPAGESMPEAPQITVINTAEPEGPFILWAGTVGGKAIYRWVEVISLDVPIVDFNGDGTVDIDDLLRLIESWGQDDPAVDLVSDGVVDKKDLEVLMDYWQQDVNDPSLLAHWALDETEGNVAYDSVSPKGGTVLGGAVWCPDAGQRKGALEFDGVDDAIVAGPVVNPSKGPFSVLAWVKGGAPGQVIFSQTGGVNWLMADASQGLLKTELRSAGRLGSSLCSQTTITDGDWHRVALVCDGSNRILYVDDVAAAQDVQTNLTGASGNLLIGAGSTLAPGTFWSGLIDDVRIYNRAVRP